LHCIWRDTALDAVAFEKVFVGKGDKLMEHDELMESLHRVFVVF
jgi:hypothetical protein